MKGALRAVAGRVVREPLIHFFAMALAIFAAYHLLNPGESDERDTIVVTEARIEQLAGLFAKTWQRPPTEAELAGLIDGFVKEEISYREAQALGLDKDDTVIRRRMRQKMEFLSLSASELREPSEAELRDHLKRNAERYAIEPSLAFSQIWLDPKRHPRLDEDVARIVADLRGTTARDPAGYGDPTLLPATMSLTRESEIARTFGTEFAAALARAPLGEWTGPIVSGYGVHVARVSERIPGRPALLDEVRAAVLRDWQDESRKAREERWFAELLKKYEVRVEGPAAARQQAAGTQP